MPSKFGIDLAGAVPKPLPDPDELATAEVAEEPTPMQRPEATTARRPRQRRSEPPAPPKVKAATTVRLRPSAAEPLNEAWLAERQATDPKLSYPEFASRIVQLGLAAYEKQQRRSA